MGTASSKPVSGSSETPSPPVPGTETVLKSVEETDDQYLSRYEASLDETKKQMVAPLSKVEKLNMARSEGFRGGRRRRKKLTKRKGKHRRKSAKR